MLKRKLTEATFDLYNPKRNKGDIQRDQSLKYCLMTSLQHIASVKVVTHLWMMKDVQSILIKSLYTFEQRESFPFFRENWSDTDEIVLDKVSSLEMPNSILSKLGHITKEMRKEISFWIKYQNTYVFNIWSNLDPMAINYVKYIVWTSRGVIDYSATARKILDGDDLSDYYKYKLACTYCLEDYIQELAPKTLHPQYLEEIELIRQPMVYFWTCHLTKNMTELMERVNNHNGITDSNDSINGYILNLLLSNSFSSLNQSSIRYIWNRLSKEEKSRKLTKIFKYNFSTDLKCYLLSQLDWEQQKEVFKSSAGAILISLFHSWLWQDYFFPTLHHVLDIMSGKDYLEVLRTLLEEISEPLKYNVQNKYESIALLFQELWQMAPAKLKEYVFQAQDGHELIDLILPLFSWSRSINLLKLIFSDGNAQQRKNILFSEHSLWECNVFLRNSQLDMLETYIGFALISEEDVDRFKEELLTRNGFVIALNFSSNEEWEKLDQFLDWIFKSTKKRNQFRKKILNELYLSKLCFSIRNGKFDPLGMDIFLQQCLKTDELIDEFRTFLSDNENLDMIPPTVFSNLMIENKFDVMDTFLNWIFYEKIDKVQNFKKNFYKNNMVFVRKVIADLIRQNDKLVSFEEYIHWLFTSDEEIEAFKKDLLLFKRKEISVTLDLLSTRSYSLADEFLNWCCNASSEEIDAVKIDVLMQNEASYAAKGYCCHESLKELLSWFAPAVSRAEESKDFVLEQKFPQPFAGMLRNFMNDEK